MARPFRISVPDEVIADLRDRLRATRWPDPAPGEPWSQGTDLDYLRDLVAYWADGFDWRAQESRLNEWPQYQVDLDDVTVHFVHRGAIDGKGLPIILTHGWPSAFIEYLPLAGMLTGPQAHGLPGPAFDVVIPSLPGYGFSRRPARPLNYRDVASTWHRLMAGLGYERYAAGGGDFGAGVASLLALDHPESVLGLHLTNLELTPYTGPGSPPLSVAEREYSATWSDWRAREGAYSALQSTKPQTLGYALNDSPAGLAAWIAEKWRTWTDPGIEPNPVSRDFLLTLLTIYWVSGSITTSMRDYYDNRWHGIELGPTDRVRVPTAICGFTHQVAFEGEPPREWAERLYDVQRWTPMPRGGHFAAIEQPELVARDLSAFFDDSAAAD
jgi:pimeloyl-ACP methyl ester carboxylesterase